MVAKLAKICALRISPQTMNFILSDKVAGGGVSMWCELEQVRPRAARGRSRTPRSPEAPLAPCLPSHRRTSSVNSRWRVSLQKTTPST